MRRFFAFKTIRWAAILLLALTLAPEPAFALKLCGSDLDSAQFNSEAALMRHALFAIHQHKDVAQAQHTHVDTLEQVHECTATMPAKTVLDVAQGAAPDRVALVPASQAREQAWRKIGPSPRGSPQKNAYLIQRSAVLLQI
ncbi:hypothetical protein FHS83_002079 [Rhizomicrobium palustre]|uniref:UrcA family protein n=1 Tax=Rhizomicrobium palustre TaxID=189966 RepID=A0A846N086_9PROT|nr:hypothetical protein [Rhizomicrobium palustre]NIK88761.1 hypothetical protein [Rhizomicrobium palustre]